MRAKESIFTAIGQRQHEQNWEEHRIVTWADEKRNEEMKKATSGATGQ
jgi:hypothetical protein